MPGGSVMADRFVDSNVLIYAAIADENDISKTERAAEVLDEGGLAFSTQVFAETYTQLTKPTRPGRLSHETAVEFLESLTESPVQAVTLDVVRVAFAIKHRYHISYWDAAIIAAAKALGCYEILSEDLHNGQDYDGVRVVNPFVG